MPTWSRCAATSSGSKSKCAPTSCSPAAWPRCPTRPFPRSTRWPRTLVKYPNPVRVEGHTDNQPINTRYYPSNWELSAARAASVVHRFARAGIAPGAALGDRLRRIPPGAAQRHASRAATRIAAWSSSSWRARARRRRPTPPAWRRRQADVDRPRRAPADALAAGAAAHPSHRVNTVTPAARSRPLARNLLLYL